MPQGLEDALNLALVHGEIAVDDGLVVASGKSGPGVHAHGVPQLVATHLRRPPDRDLVNAVREIAFSPESGFDLRWEQYALRRIDRRRRRLARTSARFLDLGED